MLKLTANQILQVKSPILQKAGMTRVDISLKLFLSREQNRERRRQVELSALVYFA